MTAAGWRDGFRAAIARWGAYQRERFPLAGHVPLVAAFSASAVCFSSLLRGRADVPSLPALLVAFLTSLSFFLQLRIADEFKDREEDARFRPYRPVPRGLVTLAELAWLGLAAGVLQLGLALWLEPSLVWLLVPAWVWLALMTREFFVPRWLRAHPLIYMSSHLVILPLIDLYATACDWRVAGGGQAPAGLSWFLAVSYLNGVVIEIGRKTRAPGDEEVGVATYSAIWGVHGAVRAWVFAVVITGAAAWEAARHIGTDRPTLALLGLLLAACGVAAHRFARDARKGSGKAIEVMAGVWTFFMYIGLGAAPIALAYWQEAQ
jgi:4-hydroxybenzoate polyprenyltransferase